MQIFLKNIAITWEIVQIAVTLQLEFEKYEESHTIHTDFYAFVRLMCERVQRHV
jgi:hypothetical protein